MPSFNLVESLEGRGQLVHVVPALLESLGVPFTGCSAHARRQRRRTRSRRSGCCAHADIATPAELRGRRRGRRGAVDREVRVRARVARASTTRRSCAARMPRSACSKRAARSSAATGSPKRSSRGASSTSRVIAAPAGRARCPSRSCASKAFRPDKPAIVGYAAKWHADSFEYRNTVRSFGVEPRARSARRAARARVLGAVRARRLRARRLSRRRVGHALRARGQRQSLPVARRRVRGRARARPAIGFGDAIAWLIADARAAAHARAQRMTKPRGVRYRRGRAAADVAGVAPARRGDGRVLPAGACGRARAARGRACATGRRAATRSSSPSGAASLLGYAAWGQAPLTRAHVRPLLDRRGAGGAGAGPGPGAARARRARRRGSRRRQLVHRNLVAAGLRPDAAVLPRGWLRPSRAPARLLRARRS